MSRKFHKPSNIIQLGNILNSAKQNNHTLYYSDTKEAVYVIEQIDLQQSILKVYIGTDPTMYSRINWDNFLKDVVFIWEKWVT